MRSSSYIYHFYVILNHFLGIRVSGGSDINSAYRMENYRYDCLWRELKRNICGVGGHSLQNRGDVVTG